MNDLVALWLLLAAYGIMMGVVSIELVIRGVFDVSNHDDAFLIVLVAVFWPLIPLFLLVRRYVRWRKNRWARQHPPPPSVSPIVRTVQAVGEAIGQFAADIHQLRSSQTPSPPGDSANEQDDLPRRTDRPEPEGHVANSRT